jgi:hypothetical protein
MSGLYLGIAAVAISAGGAITSGVMADQAGKRQVGAARRSEQFYRKGLEQIGIFEEQKSPGQLLSEDMPYLLKAADQASKQLRDQGEAYMPGSAAQREKISGIIQQRLGGEPLTGEQVDFVQRKLAEQLGAGYTPAMTGAAAPGGFQVAQGQLARNLGAMAYDVSTQAAGMAGDWARIARAYTVGAFEGPSQYALGSGELQQQKMALQLGAITGQYNALQNVGAANYAQGMGNAQSLLSGSQATASALTGAAGGMAQYQMAQNAGTNYGRLNTAGMTATSTQGYNPPTIQMDGKAYQPQMSTFQGTTYSSPKQTTSFVSPGVRSAYA